MRASTRRSRPCSHRNSDASGTVFFHETTWDVTVAMAPLFHITGMVSLMHANIFVGATLVMMPRWDRDLAGRLISNWKVTNWTNIPTMVIDLLASPNFGSYDLSSLVSVGGGEGRYCVLVINAKGFRY